MAFLLAFIFSFTCFAKLEKLIVDQGNFVYQRPSGLGEVEKLQLGLSKFVEGPYPIEISRGEKSLDLKTTFIDFSWENPLPLLHDMENLYIKKANLSLSTKTHYFVASKLKIKPQDSGEYSFDDLNISCLGISSGGRLEDRVVDDCFLHLEARILRMEIPPTSLIVGLLKDLPEVPAEINIPAWDFDMLMNKGDFKLDFRVRYYIKAGIYAWGHLQLENNRQVLAIRLDKVKYGILGVTSIVFKKLRGLNNPHIIINEPWIRIKMNENHETTTY